MIALQYATAAAAARVLMRLRRHNSTGILSEPFDAIKSPQSVCIIETDRL